MLLVHMGKGLSNHVCSWTPESGSGHPLSKTWEVSVLCHQTEWVQPHLSQQSTQGAMQRGQSAGSLCPITTREEGWGCRPSLLSSGRALPRHYLQDCAAIPMPSLPQLGSLCSDGLQHTPAHPPAREAPKFNVSLEKKAAWHISGGEGYRQGTEQALRE